VTNDTPAGSSYAVRQYYQQNTRFFLTYGRQSQTRTIHRAVWAPDVADRQAALNYSNRLILAQLLELGQKNLETTVRAADLGCGVGGSLFYLVSRLPEYFRGVGLTISSDQARIAQRYAGQLQLEQRCAFIEADFQHLPLAGGFEAAFSIEAFAHSSDPAAYLREAARLLGEGGLLMLCDDFLTDLGAGDNYWLQAFQQGWQVPGLRSAEQVKELARANGLELIEESDLTPYLRLNAVPTWLVRAMVATGTRFKHIYWQSVTGGVALQQCLKQGLVRYLFIVFEKTV
jgi:cyclopropane fatty-acyl-phospholipid synthase-like methyltransferase